MFALIYQINFWQQKNMSDKNSSVNKNLSMETKQKEVLFQNPNKLQNGLFGNEQKAAGNNLGLENKLEVSKKSGKMKYILFAVAIALFIIAGLTLFNIPLQLVGIDEIIAVFIVSFSSLLGVLLYSFYKNVDKKESELLIQNGTNQLEIIGENKSKDMTRNRITVEKPKNVIEQINDVQIISNRVETDKSKKTAENQITMIQGHAKTPELKIQNEINRIEIISENKPKNIIQNQIIVEKKLEPEIEQVNSIKILGNKMDKAESSEQKIIIQNDNDIHSNDTEVEKPTNKNAKLEIQSKINQLEIIGDNQSKDITQNQIIVEKSEQQNVFEQINSLQILGEKTNKKEIGGQKIIMQDDDNASNYDIENEKLNELLEQLKDNGLTVTYDSENRECKIERPENVFEQIDEIEITAKERSENVFEQIDEIEITAKERPENVFEQIDEIEITAKERPENVFEQIDEIEITAKERPENVFEQIDEIEILAKERPENIEESIDEIELLAKERPENIEESIDEIQIAAKDRPKNNVIDKINSIEIIHVPKLEKKEDQNALNFNNSK